ncbi:thiopeptide-type bacteriocin biosynthesis protein [Tenacibaculum sp.]|nr:thiopeptide-type bacteriocin biosynthesis protein [Tenacibaculum sp.]
MKTSSKEVFIPGEEWLYYKIYCGVISANNILLNCLNPLAEKLLKGKSISKWFFIRYIDPDNHIRVRFLLNDVENISEVILQFNEAINPYIKSKEVWNIEIATYKRELERYGGSVINEVETLFFYDTKMILAIIEKTENENFLFLKVLNWVETILLLFNIGKEEELLFLKEQQEQFKEEFNVNKAIRKKLSVKYRGLENSFSIESEFEAVHINGIKEIIDYLLKKHKDGELNVKLKRLLASCIHMTINRSFNSKQRLYEMLIYDFLYRKNKSKLMRNERV